ncbi:MAG: hypothetical protein HW394_1873 [Acidobacteria bacterium]|nr:hypothetical protein [Acidobacteriota bacterium]
MTWKAYTAVSGATVLAGWLAAPSNAPDTGAAAPSQTVSRRATPSSDIEREAMRLQARVRREAAYTQPHRNLFRFGAARPIARSGIDLPEAAPPAETPVPAVPPLPPVSLAGIAEDQVEQRVERTAILSFADGVLLVHEGDDVLGQYRVARIESEAVELVKRADGTTLRLSLSNPKSQ